MSVPKHINSKYSAIIFEDTDGFIKARTSATGTFVFSGLSTDQKNTTLLVSTIAIPLPAVALTGRNSIAIRNLDSSEILYIGKSDVQASDNIGTTSGWQIGPNETYNVDITDSIVLYGIVSSGSIKIQVRELA